MKCSYQKPQLPSLLGALPTDIGRELALVVSRGLVVAAEEFVDLPLVEIPTVDVQLTPLYLASKMDPLGQSIKAQPSSVVPFQTTLWVRDGFYGPVWSSTHWVKCPASWENTGLL